MAAGHADLKLFPVEEAWSNAAQVDKASINSSQLLSSLALALGTHHNPQVDYNEEVFTHKVTGPELSQHVALVAALRTPDFVGSFAEESKWSADTPNGDSKAQTSLRRQRSAERTSKHETTWGALSQTDEPSQLQCDEVCAECQQRQDNSAAFAAYVGHLSCLKALAINGHDSVYAADDLGRTSLFYAAASPSKMAQTDCLRLLLSIDDEWIDVGDIHGNTPLAVAACRGRADAVNELLASGAQVGLANTSGQTPLHACSSPECLEALLRFAHQDMLYALDDQGRSPLMIMCVQGNAPCLDILLQADADGGTLYLLEAQRGNSPLHAAAASGSIDCVKSLVAALDLPGLPTNCLDHTPVEEAYKSGHLHLAIFLLQYEAWLSGDSRAVSHCKDHLSSIQAMLAAPGPGYEKNFGASIEVRASAVPQSESGAFCLDNLAVDVKQPLGPSLSAHPLSPGASSLFVQAAWLTKGKIPQIASSHRDTAAVKEGAAPIAALPDFNQLRSSKLRLPPLQGGSKALSPLVGQAAPAAVAVPERRLSGTVSVHSRRQSLARQRSLKAAALVELSPMPRNSAVFTDNMKTTAT